MYSVYQHWDPLKVCIVGKSYSPEFYSFIKNDKVRIVMEKIASDTEEDYQKLISLLESFNVKILRPELTDNYLDYLDPNTGKIIPPPMTPRDYSFMVGKTFYWQRELWDVEYHTHGSKIKPGSKLDLMLRKTWKNVFDDIQAAGNTIIETPPPGVNNINGASNIRVGKDIYCSATVNHANSIIFGDTLKHYEGLKKIFKDYRFTGIHGGGHADGVMCAVTPGLIISLEDEVYQTYSETFPSWEVINLPGESWEKVQAWSNLKHKNDGKWWVPGEELNDDFTNFVEEWLDHWVGYVEESVFDVNMLVINKQNVVCSNYNEKVFEALNRYGVTPHIINFRHRYFWDGGLHCITSDLDREGVMEDYFPERG
jgi:glycine amidinotransferase